MSKDSKDDYFRIEHSKSSRAKCRFCRRPINRGELRVGNPYDPPRGSPKLHYAGFWHLGCALSHRNYHGAWSSQVDFALETLEPEAHRFLSAMERAVLEERTTPPDPDPDRAKEEWGFRVPFSPTPHHGKPCRNYWPRSTRLERTDREEKAFQRERVRERLLPLVRQDWPGWASRTALPDFHAGCTTIVLDLVNEFGTPDDLPLAKKAVLSSQFWKALVPDMYISESMKKFEAELAFQRRANG